MVSSQDHKRIGEGDTGLNTGGMGAYAPTTIISEKMMEQIVEEILEPTIKGLADQGRKYTGVLYTGLIITERGPRVLEYNCRFGDPETQAVLPLLESDLVQIFSDIVDGFLDPDDIKWKEDYSVCVVLASGGYPDATTKGAVIEGLDKCETDGCTIFYAGVGLEDGKLVTNGGRVLGIAKEGITIKEALNKAYDCINRIKFNGMQYRRDIGWRSGKVNKNYF